MKNINVLPTEKPSCKLQKTKHGNFFLSNEIKLYSDCINQNIYITSDEEIKEGVDQWYLDKVLNRPYNSGGAQYSSKQDVIIMTTDQDLIKDGGQAIDDEFLEWFVANPSCEKVEVEESNLLNTSRTYLEVEKYKIIIPKEESKQHLPLNQNKMTPEEKAVQLIDAVGEMVAMFVVDEIIESRKEDSAFDDRHFAKGSKYYTPHPMYFTYWKEVKNEIFNHKSE
jgi:hypothetical protein